MLFPFGFGLSYTTFEYSDLTVSEKEATFTLRNTGKMDGAEVAQLYVSKTDGEVFRPAKELKGFQKVFLKAGESKKVTIQLDDKAFRYIARFEELLPLLADTSGLEKQLTILKAQHTEKLNSLRRYMEENTRLVQNQTEYNRRFSEMEAECAALEEKVKGLQSEILAQQGRREQIRRCLDELRQCGDILEEFDVDPWNVTVESAKISADRILTFRFRDGTEIPVQIPKKK